jgi:hypothetical protein
VSYDRGIPTMGCAGSRKFKYSALLIPFLCAHIAQAQSFVALNVTVGGQVSMQTTAIDFGRITPGQTQIVPPQRDVANGAAGKVNLTYNVDGLSVTIPATMTLYSQGAQIQATLTCAAVPVSGGTTATPFSCNDGVTFGGSTGSSGPMVFVGGVVPGSETIGKPAGVYTGAVVVTAQSTST